MIDIKGARWYKTDLHLHTMESQCFEDKTVTAEQWVQECLNKGLQCVAVTDHNTGNCIDAIKSAANGTGLTVFPGVEITCGEAKAHVLVIFDKDKGTQEVNSFLSRLRLEPSEFGKQDAKVRMSVLEIAAEAAEVGAITIPAHIDQFNGLAMFDHSSRKEIFESDNIHGVQAVHDFFIPQINLTDEELLEKINQLYGEGTVPISDAKKWGKCIEQGIKTGIPVLTFSDNPASENSTKHGLWGIGNRYTWLKMDEEATLESLRQALLMPELRVHNDFNSNKEPKREPDFWINKIKIIDTALNHNNTNTLYFNPQMTSIIGGRGTGKSGITRLIRGSFALNRELEEHKELYEEQKEFYKLQNTTGSQEPTGVLKATSSIEIILVRYGEKYKLKVGNFQSKNQKRSLSLWSKTSNEYKEFNEEEGNSLISLFNFEIYSQKQIYEIAKRPNALREKIDLAIQDMKKVQEERLDLKRKFLHISNEIRNINEEIDKKTIIEAEIKDKETQLKKIKENDYQNIFNQNDIFLKERKHYENLIKNISAQRGEVESLQRKLIITSPLNKNFQEKYRTEISNMDNIYNEKFQEVLSDLVAIEEKFLKLEETLNSSIEKSMWNEEFNLHKETYNKLKEKLGKEDIQYINNIEKMNEELMDKRSQLTQLDNKEKMIQDLILEQEKYQCDYNVLREKMRRMRQEFIQSVLKDQKNIKIDIRKFRDQSSYETNFRRIIQRETNFSENINKIMKFCFEGNVEKKIPELIKKIEEVRNGNENELFTGKFPSLLKDLNDQQIDELKLLMPEDDIQVSYRGNDGAFKSLSNASAGQKTSAILTFLLSYGDAPLILDQPEDDLDNYLIYELIVERLKATKSKRQIIVVTHNANIPVNGDSELIIVMDSHSKNIQPAYIGSIENNDIKANICEVMEGGEAAFKLRAKRYNLHV